MNPQELRDRTKRLALDIVKAVRELPPNEVSRIIGRQVLRSATSVAANYRASTRARSRREFISKIGLVIEEMDETILWLELLRDGEILPGTALHRYSTSLTNYSESLPPPAARLAPQIANHKSPITNRKTPRLSPGRHFHREPEGRFPYSTSPRSGSSMIAFSLSVV